MRKNLISVGALCALIFVVAVVAFSSCEKVVFSDDIESSLRGLHAPELRGL